MGRRERKGEERRAQGRQTGAEGQRGALLACWAGGARPAEGRAGGLLSQWGRAGAGWGVQSGKQLCLWNTMS